MEAVADTRGLSLVGPAVNYCDPTPGANHAGACTRERAARTFTLSEYSVSKAKDAPYNIFDWLASQSKIL